MSYDSHVDDLLVAYQQQRTSMTDLQNRMREISASATSPRKEVTVTVGRGGAITDIAFPTSAYKRMTPKELSAAIMQAFAEAKEQAMDQAAQLLGPLLPKGMDAAKMVRGEASVDMYLPPDGPRVTRSVRAFLGLDEEQP